VRPSILEEIERELFKELASILGAFKGHIFKRMFSIYLSH